MKFTAKEHYDINDLLGIMRALRGEGGCPWDRKQDHHSIRNNFLEEVYEVIEAIDNDDSVLLREELGDVLLQVVFHSAMEAEAGRFDFSDVVNDICVKLVVRHPHVFGNVRANNEEEALKSWETAKADSKGQKTDSQKLKSVAKTLPALMRSQKVQGRASKAGVDFESVEETLSCLKKEIGKLEAVLQNGSDGQIADGMGDVLFSAVSLARMLKLDSEEELSKSCDRFTDRFVRLEKMLDKPVSACPRDEVKKLWREIKE